MLRVTYEYAVRLATYNVFVFLKRGRNIKSTVITITIRLLFSYYFIAYCFVTAHTSRKTKLRKCSINVLLAE